MSSDYQKLIVWTKSKDLAVAIYRALSGSREFALRDQMQRAAVSIPSNIAEGYTRESDADRAHFLTIARSSVAELETQLIIAQELGFIAEPAIKSLLSECDEVSRMLYALRARLKEASVKQP